MPGGSEGRSRHRDPQSLNPTCCAPEEPWTLVIGRVMAPFGIRGEVRVKPETDFPERFGRLEEVRLELPGGEQRTARVVGARLTPRGVLVKFAECQDRAQAEALRGAWVKVRPSMAAPLPEGSYYLHQIFGLRVVTPDGQELGEVTEVVRTPANDVYVCGELMIPAVRKYVKEINLERGVMVVEAPREEGDDRAD